MADRFDNFTKPARRVLTLAQEEAQLFNHNYLGTEHLLLGLMRESECVACKVLTNLGANPAKVASAVEFIIGRGEHRVTGEISLTPRAQKVIELAVEEARRLNHSYIATEHLLLGLIREGEGIAFGVLESLGISLDKVRQETLHVLANQPARARPDPPMEPLRLPPPIEETKRVSARAALEGAVNRIADVPGGRPERDLLEALLRPLLTTLMEDLDVLSNDAARYPEARHRVERALPTLANAASVAIRHGHAALGDALTRAMVSVMDVLT